jgi:hypothetical protein
MSDIEKLRAFAQDILEGWPEVPQWDGLGLQEIATKHGLLESKTVTESCGEGCNCVEYDDFPMQCFRPSKLLKGDTSAAETSAALEKPPLSKQYEGRSHRGIARDWHYPCTDNDCWCWGSEHHNPNHTLNR